MPEPDPTSPLDSGEGPEDVIKASTSPITVDPDGKRPPSRRGSQPQTFAKVAGMGFELAAATLVVAGLGHLVDRYCGGSRSIGFAIGGFVGFGLGMYRFIVKALKNIEETDK